MFLNQAVSIGLLCHSKLYFKGNKNPCYKYPCEVSGCPGCKVTKRITTLVINKNRASQS